MPISNVNQILRRCGGCQEEFDITKLPKVLRKSIEDGAKPYCEPCLIFAVKAVYGLGGGGVETMMATAATATTTTSSGCVNTRNSTVGTKTTRKKISFRISTPSGIYQYCRMEMGLKVFPDEAQAMMEQRVLQGSDVEVYIDDIAIFSDSFEAHLELISKDVDRLQAMYASLT